MNPADLWRNARAEHWLTAAWSQGFCKALTLLNPDGGPGFSLESQDPNDQAWRDWERSVWVLFPCDIADAAGLSVGCSEAIMGCLGCLALGASEDADGLAAETYRELISQASASVEEAIEQNRGDEVRFAGGVDVSEPDDPSLGVELWFELDGERHSLAVVPNATLLDALFSAGPQESEAPEPETRKPDADDGESGDLGDLGRRNLEMLLDLDMEVAVSFGQTEMLLKDVLKLSVGSIVELNCQASDPVEVLVNDTVIARGEVVVVDSNYGVRITDVRSRKERIRSIL